MNAETVQLRVKLVQLMSHCCFVSETNAHSWICIM